MVIGQLPAFLQSGSDEGLIRPSPLSTTGLRFLGLNLSSVS